MSNQRLYRHTAARYGSMIVFANDTGAVTASLLRYGEWAETEIAFMASLLGEDATVLDVGAYVGTHTLAFSRLVGSEGRVIAFEPQPASFEVLKKNVAFNRLANVTLHEAGVSETSGEAAFPATDPAMSASFGSAPLEAETGRASPEEPAAAQVRIITIDGLNLERCDLIKIDVEGMESAVIRGAQATIERHRPWIYAECNSVEGGLATRQALLALGYDVRLHVAEAFNPQNLRGETHSIFADACEAALVGVPPAGAERLQRRPMGTGEMLLALDTADDLVLGMLNKPQYVDEVLRTGSAAASGGDKWIRNASGATSVRAQDIARLSDQLAATQEALETTQALAVEREAEVGRLSAQLARTQEALETTQALAVEGGAESARLSAQLARTQEALETTQALAVERFQQIDQLEAMMNATLHQADIARSHYNEQIRASEGARQEAERLATALARIEADQGRERDQVAALLNSTSWRLTKPVRVVSRALRGR